MENTMLKLEELRQERNNEAERMITLSNYCESIRIWADDFDKADTETKKMILAHLIERITVDKDYNLHIKFFITREEFHWGNEKCSVTVSEADSFMTA